MLQIASRRILLPVQSRYLLNDDFITARVAGAVVNTLAEPGPGFRQVVTDTNSKLSISGDLLIFITGGVAAGDPGIWYEAVRRAPGTILIAEHTPGTATPQTMVGWDIAQSAFISDGIRFSTSNVLGVVVNGTTINIGTFTTSVSYPVAVVMRTSGHFYFVKISGNWLLYWISTATSATGFPAIGPISGTTAIGTSDYIRVPRAVWLPTPIVSDGFASSFETSDGLGHAEIGTGSGGNGVTWTQQSGTWTVSSGKAGVSALSVEAIATVPLSTADALIGIDLVRTLLSVGGVARYTDANNYLRFYHDGTNAVLQQVVATVPTTLITAAATYAANARIVLWLNGTSARLYYNNLLVGSTASIDAGLTAAVAGLYTTDLTNTMDNFVAYSVGTGGQHSILNSF